MYGSFLARARALILALVVFVPAGTAPSAADITCYPVLSHVNFLGLDRAPARPEVGDHVDLTFLIELSVYAVSSMTLVGAESSFEGETTLIGGGDSVFHLTAVQAGRATVQMALAFLAEEACVDDETMFMFFRPGPVQTVMSPPYEVDIAPASPTCRGDCDGDGRVDIGELVRGVEMALSGGSVDACPALDTNRDARATVDELVVAVDSALRDCAPPPSPSPTSSTASPTPTATNPPGACCCPGAVNFPECQQLAQQGTCFGWGDPCPTRTVPPRPPVRGG
jgi:hypothetical protein